MLNPIFFLYSFFLFYLFFPSLSYCADLTSDQQKAIKENIQSEQILRNEKNDLIRNKQIEEIKNIQKSKSESPVILEEEFPDEGVCKIVKNFILRGNERFSANHLNNKFFKKYHACWTKADLNKLRSDIENYYLKNDLVLARVYFDLTSLAKGIVIVVIEEGKLENLEIKDNSKLNDKLPFRRSLQKFFAFPISPGDVINLRDIEQGLDQINRLSSQSAKMTADASSQSGYSNIIIDNQISDLSSLNFGADNSGNKRTGKERRKIGWNQDNLLGINDNILLNYTQTNDATSNTRYSKSFYGAASIPFGYWTIGGSYSYSQYLLTSAGSFALVRSSGNSENKTYYIERVLDRGKRYKISLKTELEKNDIDSYLENTYVDINSRRTTISNVYLNNTIYLKNGSIYLQAKYSKGLRGFKAKVDANNLAKDQPRAQFESYGLYGQVNNNFFIPKTSFPLSYKLTFDSSYSQDSLYGNNQFAIGGRHTIRGFQESVISGDCGYYLRNDLKTPLSNLLPKIILQPAIINSLFSGINFGVFYDYGYVRNKVINEESDKGRMSGGGFVFSYVGKNFTGDLSYSKGFNSPNFLRTIDRLAKEKETIYFSLNFNLGVL